jgi:hypothetical protein
MRAVAAGSRAANAGREVEAADHRSVRPTADRESPAAGGSASGNKPFLVARNLMSMSMENASMASPKRASSTLITQKRTLPPHTV